MIWQALQYNLEVKAICFNNKINQIKTRNLYNNISILFKLYAPDTYIQNNGAKHFSFLIIKKRQAIRLYLNLPYKLWKEIIVAVIYLYNQTFYTSKN